MAIQEIDSLLPGDNLTITNFILVLAFQRAVTLIIKPWTAPMADGTRTVSSKDKILMPRIW